MIDVNTKLYAVVGYPVTHSRSPQVFNELFVRYKWNGFYFFLQKQNPKEVEILLQTLPLQGISVTMPHKQAAFSWATQVADSAQKVGVANTIIRQENGSLLASNEDYESFISLVREKIPPSYQKKVLILGKGAIAKTSATALLELGHVQEILFLVRNTENKPLLPAHKISISWHLQDQYPHAAHQDVGLIINATSVGTPPGEEFLLPGKYIHGKAVIDWVYRFEETQLIQWSKDQPHIKGKELFISQAARQFTRFTGLTISPQEILEIVSCPPK